MTSFPMGMPAFSRQRFVLPESPFESSFDVMGRRKASISGGVGLRCNFLERTIPVHFLVRFTRNHCVPGMRGLLAVAFAKYSAINHSGGELEIIRYSNHDQLAEISNSLEPRAITPPVERDGFHFQEIIAGHAVRALSHRIVPLDAKHDVG